MKLLVGLIAGLLVVVQQTPKTNKDRLKGLVEDGCMMRCHEVGKRMVCKQECPKTNSQLPCRSTQGHERILWEVGLARPYSTSLKELKHDLDTNDQQHSIPYRVVAPGRVLVCTDVPYTLDVISESWAVKSIKQVH